MRSTPRLTCNPEKARHIEYGYAVDGMKNVRAEWIIAAGDGLTTQAFQGTSAKAEVALFTNSPQQDLAPVKERASLELAQPAKQHDFAIGF